MVHDLSGRGHHLSITAEPRWNCVVFLHNPASQLLARGKSFGDVLHLGTWQVYGKCMASVWQRLRLPGVP